ncbi:hypothetical protein L7F22_058236 [Adiantum nelumboides]|nr:hypothetical protein [Adiantum nelumboides]
MMAFLWHGLGRGAPGGDWDIQSSGSCHEEEELLDGPASAWEGVQGLLRLYASCPSDTDLLEVQLLWVHQMDLHCLCLNPTCQLVVLSTQKDRSSSPRGVQEGGCPMASLSNENVDVDMDVKQSDATNSMAPEAVIDWRIVAPLLGLHAIFTSMESVMVTVVLRSPSIVQSACIMPWRRSSSQIVLANCGDSRAVLSKGGKAIPLSHDHKAERGDETNRIEAAGGRVIAWKGYRVGGMLAVSRAIGD